MGYVPPPIFRCQDDVDKWLRSRHRFHRSVLWGLLLVVLPCLLFLAYAIIRHA